MLFYAPSLWFVWLDLLGLLDTVLLMAVFNLDIKLLLIIELYLLWYSFVWRVATF